jgi:ribonuclease Z
VADGPGWRAAAEYVNHGNSLGLSEADWPCLGYRLDVDGRVIAIGGDAAAGEGLDRLALGAEVLVVSCYLAEAEITSPGFATTAEHIIVSSGQVGQIAARAGVSRLVLTHFRRKSTELMQSLVADVRADFKGELDIGEDGLVIEF